MRMRKAIFRRVDSNADWRNTQFLITYRSNGVFGACPTMRAIDVGRGRILLEFGVAFSMRLLK